MLVKYDGTLLLLLVFLVVDVIVGCLVVGVVVVVLGDVVVDLRWRVVGVPLLESFLEFSEHFEPLLKLLEDESFLRRWLF